MHLQKHAFEQSGAGINLSNVTITSDCALSREGWEPHVVHEPGMLVQLLSDLHDIHSSNGAIHELYPPAYSADR